MTVDFPTTKAFVQRPAPIFEADAVVNGSFEKVSLQKYKGALSFLRLICAGKWVVLLFYPLDFTFVCPTEILGFNDRLKEFHNLGAEVLAISTDSEINTSRKEGGLGSDLKMIMVADKNHSISRDYGVLLPNDGIALRGMFLIDPKGTLRQITVNDLPVGRSVDETLRLLQAFQFTDKHGEVCPLNWNPETNAKTMVADPQKSKAYFQAVNH